MQALRYQWNSVELEASANRESLLVLTDTWFPGWTATVNGKEVPIYRANSYFRAVPLSPGLNRVKFVYRPWQFTAGCAVTFFTLLTLSILGALRWYADRKASVAAT